MKKVVVGMSGGVDSSVSVILLKEMGYEVIGVTFKMLDDFDASDAINVANMLGIEHHIIDISDDFKNTIIKSFIDDYNNGITPNPCVLCNKKIKLKYLYDAMIRYGADYFSTGHYAKVIDGNLYKSSDVNKDQTYFLAQVDKNILEKALFPLEGITKDVVRKMAAEHNLINANKKDSYDVCFITDKFKNFIESNSNSKPGDIIDVDTGKVYGRHNGLCFYTIGQRKGLNIGGAQDKVFVVGKDLSKNILYIALGNDNEYLYSDGCIIKNVNFIKTDRVYECNAKFRYRSQEISVKLEYLDDGRIKVNYDKCKSVTPGQSCVFYLDDMCIGGGVIDEVLMDDNKIWYLS